LRTAFIISLVSAVMSLVAIFGISAMTFVPRAESSQERLMLASAAFFLVWLSLAIWLRPGARPVSLPRWARGLLVSAGVIYVLLILFFVIG